MPPQLHSDSSDEDIIQPHKPARKNLKAAATANVEESDNEVNSNEASGDEGAESDASDEYTVEAIMDHRFEGNNLFFHVKWQDYPLKKDWTWEPEEHLTGGSQDILQEYYRSIGGRPVKSPKVTAEPKSARKRGRQSTTGASVSATPAKSTKKARHSIVSASAASPSIRNSTEEKEAKWSPPSGNWEERIAHIDTIEKTDNGLVCYVQWDNGKKSQHDIGVCYKKCPQRMLTFYEQHLVFKETGAL